ncbi:MAG TPA: polyprenol phosphomannose-dependent alpha 1,6 mannosyltransferase MptB [Thermoleophilaceae bacterium]|jgi:alpha-1,6-mannosyltransferase|nr:polyprenol phosphomannose-dependent alpha 1,6 mannosyltransferase MptB [Thermoleophilaceae bacterium]
MVWATDRIATGAGRIYSYLVPSARHAFPQWMRGPLADISSQLGAHRFVVLLAVMSVAYVVVLVVAPQLPARLVLAVIALLVAMLAVAPPLLSTDVFNYVAYARMGTHGINPYAHGTVDFRFDASYPYVGHFWNRTPTAYGPLFTLLSYAVAPLGVGGGMWVFKAVAALATLACVFLVWKIAPLLGRQPLRAAVLIGLNPLVLVFGVGGGHNDALVALALLGGTWLMLRDREMAGGAVIATAAAVKLSAGLVLPFLAIGARRRGRTIAGIVAATVILFAIGFLAFGPSLTGMMDAVRVQERYGYSWTALNGFPRYYLHLARAGPETRLALKVLFVGASLLLAVRCFWTRNWLAAAGWSTFVLLLTAGWVLPWYVLWLLPLAALARSRLLVPATVAITLAVTGMWALHYLQPVHHRHHHHRVHHVHHHHGVRATAASSDATRKVKLSSR